MIQPEDVLGFLTQAVIGAVLSIPQLIGWPMTIIVLLLLAWVLLKPTPSRRRRH